MTKLNTTRLNELPIKTILDDDDYVVISGRGTKKLKIKDITKDVEKKAADLEVKTKELGSQLEHNVTLGYANSKIQTSKKRFESNFINLLDFNVDSTGAVDCCAQLQNAIDYAYTEKTPLYIPPGIYKLSSKSIICSQVESGDGSTYCLSFSSGRVSGS